MQKVSFKKRAPRAVRVASRLHRPRPLLCPFLWRISVDSKSKSSCVDAPKVQN